VSLGGDLDERRDGAGHGRPPGLLLLQWLDQDSELTGGSVREIAKDVEPPGELGEIVRWTDRRGGELEHVADRLV